MTPRDLQGAVARRTCVLVAVTALLLAVAGTAAAGFQTTTTAQSLGLSTLTVAPATNLVASAACGPLGSLSASVTLTWTGTTTARATSYTVRRATTALYSDVKQAALGSTSYLDTGLAPATAYAYVLRTNLNGWCADTAPVTVTTPAQCL